MYIFESGFSILALYIATTILITSNAQEMQSNQASINMSNYKDLYKEMLAKNNTGNTAGAGSENPFKGLLQGNKTDLSSAELTGLYNNQTTTTTEAPIEIVEADANSTQFEAEFNGTNMTTEEPEQEDSVETIPPTNGTTLKPKTTTLVSIPMSKDEHKKFISQFALYNCERLKQCNVLPTTIICARDSFYGAFSWFENICQMWKANCFRLGIWFVHHNEKCENYNKLNPGMKILNFTHPLINPKWIS